MLCAWLEDQEQQLFYIRIRTLEKCWNKCIYILQEAVLKSDEMWKISGTF